MKRRGYDRPHDPWSCGLEGAPCAAGPTARGRCPALGECVPVREGDRWVCNRSEGRGGPCDEGPSPDGGCCLARRCKPRPSLRLVRGRWLTGAALFTIGAGLVLLGAESRNDLVAPGPLTSHHAQVIARAKGSNRCATCHPGANDGPLAWGAAAWNGAGTHGDTSQAALCLKCHAELSTPERAPLLAHGLPAERLPRRDAPSPLVRAGVLDLRLPGRPAHGMSDDDPLACAACHQEHHGSRHDLSAITDARCQACHAERYDSFADGHPDFGLWPVRRRTRLAFNHASHGARHFPKAGRAMDCRACHLDDATGDLTARPDYQAACGACHEADLVKSFGDGLTLVALPTIDPDAIDTGRWPAGATGDFDGELPPFTKMLLASDDAAAGAMRVLGEDFSFFDVDEEDATQVTAARAIIDALRRLLDDLQEEGHGAVGYRLRELVGGRAASDADYVGRLPMELVDRVQATWLGDATPPEEFDTVEDRRTGGGWIVDDDRLALRYRPTGHDDPLVRAWLDAAVAIPDEQASLREAVLAEFARPGAPGMCLTCHSVERAAGRLVVNWRGRDRLREARGFTKFSHRPHLTQPELADCTHCHRVDPQGDPSAAYTGLDPTRSASEFAAMSKSACSACHKPHAAGDACTQCHNYHVEVGR